MTSTKRNVLIDIARGTAIFLMLWGHCIQFCLAGSSIDYYKITVYQIIYSFHMPLFMLISGYLFFFSFSKRSKKELLVYRTQSLIQPIVAGAVFSYLVTSVFFNALSGNFSLLFDGSWLYTLPSLWFLWSVLAASLAVILVCKSFDSIAVQAVLLLVMVLIPAVLPNRNLNIYVYPYFIIGFYFGKYKDTIPANIHKLRYLFLVLYPVMMCFYEKKHFIYTTGTMLFPNYKRPLPEMLVTDIYRWAVGLAGSVFVLTVLDLAYRHIALKLSRPMLFEPLAKLGRKSLQIYVLSVPFLSVYLPAVFSKLLSIAGIENIFVKNMFVYNFAFTLPVAVLYSVGLYIILIILEKLKLAQIIFGK